MHVVLEKAQLNDIEANGARYVETLVSGYGDLQTATEDVLAILRAFEQDPDNDTWGAYWARPEAGGPYLGLCGFKGPPNPERVAEIAYCTFPSHRMKGVAKGMVAALNSVAKDYGIVEILAHTLPERNESTSVLERSGFRLQGEVLDPEDGPVWAWRIEL